MRIRLLLMLASAGLSVCGPAVAAPPGAGPAGFPLDFDSEVIRLFIRGDSLDVEGLYDFVCRPIPVPLVPMLYPYPVDSLLGGSRMVSLEGRDSTGAWWPLEFEEVPSFPGAAWRIPANWDDTLRVKAVYRQALRGRYARYIVTTTGGWGRALRMARFEIHLPARARPVRFSHPFKLRCPGAGSSYVYEALNFLPTRDIIVEWTESN